MQNSTFIGELKTWRNIHMNTSIHTASKTEERKDLQKFIQCERFHCILQMLLDFWMGMMELLRQFITDFDGYFDTLMNWTLQRRPIPDRILEAVDWFDQSHVTAGWRQVGNEMGGGARWGWWLVVQFGSPSVATSGGYYKHTFQTNRERRERRIRSVERFSRNTEVKNRSKWRTEQNRMESKEQQ